MDLELTGKIVLVTGGLAGIGAAISRRLAAEGAIPMIADRGDDRAFVDELQRGFSALAESRPYHRPVVRGRRRLYPSRSSCILTRPSKP